MQQLYTNPTFQAKYYQRINKVIALSLTSLSSAHQRETHVANFFFWLATATIAIVAATCSHL